MQRDQSTGSLKMWVKIVGLLLLFSVLFVVIFAAEGTRPLGYLLFAGIGCLAWRMFRVWDKWTVRLYALIQSIMTGVTLGQLSGLFWPDLKYAISGFVLICFGPPFERFLLRYTGFSRALPKVDSKPDEGSEVVGTPWQNDPSHTAL